MPINTVQQYVKSHLDGMNLPLGLGQVQAYITPPNPGEAVTPQVFIWGSHGDETRLTVPRAEYQALSTGGDKTLVHRLDVWVVWFGSTEEPTADAAFPAVIDALMGVLRNMPLVDAAGNTQHLTDPVTGQLSQIVKLGENMSWDYGPVRAVADQRYLRYDALINCEVTEIIQS